MTTGSVELDLLLAAAAAAGATCFYDDATVTVDGLAFIPARQMTYHEAHLALADAFGGKGGNA